MSPSVEENRERAPMTLDSFEADLRRALKATLTWLDDGIARMTATRDVLRSRVDEYEERASDR